MFNVLYLRSSFGCPSPLLLPEFPRVLASQPPWDDLSRGPSASPFPLWHLWSSSLQNPLNRWRPRRSPVLSLSLSLSLKSESDFNARLERRRKHTPQVFRMCMRILMCVCKERWSEIAWSRLKGAEQKKRKREKRGRILNLLPRLCWGA